MWALQVDTLHYCNVKVTSEEAMRKSFVASDVLRNKWKQRKFTELTASTTCKFFFNRLDYLTEKRTLEMK